jgi:hypothetical protein
VHVDDVMIAAPSDDVMIAAPSESELDGLLKELEEHYTGLTVNRGRVLNYLGMVFDFKTEGLCKVTMDGFVEDLLSTYQEIKGPRVRQLKRSYSA